MESVSKITIFVVKMMVKIDLEKIFLKFLPAGYYFPFLHKSVQNRKFSNKINYLSEWRDFNIILENTWTFLALETEGSKNNSNALIFYLPLAMN